MDNVQKRGLARLLLRWPTRRADLIRVAQSHPALGELCEAYETACTAMEHWSRSSAPVAAERTREYRTLVRATEEDILAILADH